MSFASGVGAADFPVRGQLLQAAGAKELPAVPIVKEEPAPLPPSDGSPARPDTLREFARIEAEAVRWTEAYFKAPIFSSERREAGRKVAALTEAAGTLLSAPGAFVGYSRSSLERFGARLDHNYLGAPERGGLERFYRISEGIIFQAAYDAFAREAATYNQRKLRGAFWSYNRRWLEAPLKSLSKAYYKRCRDLAWTEEGRRFPLPPIVPKPPRPGLL